MTTHPDVSAVIIGAGLSSRMGVDKLALSWQGSTIIETIISTLTSAGMGDITLVLRPAQEDVISLLKNQTKTGLVKLALLDPFFENDMLASIQCGISSLSSEYLYAMICLGDQPHIQSKIVNRLLTARINNDKSLIVPSYQMKRGHPWLIKNNLWSDLLSSPHQMTPRSFLNAHEKETQYVRVENDSILKDIDTPEDYNSLKE